MKIDKVTLQKLVNNSSNRKELLDKLKITSSGDNYRKLEKLLDEYQINIPDTFIINKVDKSHLSNEEIFVKNSLYKRSIRDKLLSENLKEYKCEKCNRTKWEEEPIPLEVHHINGDHNDNRLENLQLLCPNCHALTDNYRGKNQNRCKNKYSYYHVCQKCGKPLNSPSATLCIECYAKTRRKVERPSKEELLELIKTKSFKEIGKIYNVSDNTIRKWCKSEGLPHLKSEIKKLYN